MAFATRLRSVRTFPVRLAAWLIMVVVHAAAMPAQDGASPRTLAQLQHSTWTPRDGAPSDANTIAETPDGYLWIGATSGLYRFDGEHFEPVTVLGGVSILNQAVVRLAADPKGGLWVGFGSGGAGFYKDGVYTRFGPDQGVKSMSQIVFDADGTTWMIVNGRLARFVGGRPTAVGAEEGFSARRTIDLKIDDAGTLWVSTSEDSGTYYRPRGASAFLQVKIGFNAQKLAIAPDGTIFGTSASGMNALLLKEGRPERVVNVTKSPLGNLIFDRGGDLWVQSPTGLLHVNAYRNLLAPDAERALGADLLGPREGLTSETIIAFFEDRRGAIWLATAMGLDRFRATKLTPIRLPRRTLGFAVAPAEDGSIWAVNWEGGLMRVTDKRIEEISGVGPRTNVLYRDRAGTVWAAGQTGLWRHLAGDTFVREDIPDGLVNEIPMSLTTTAANELVVSTLTQSVVRREKQWRRFQADAGGRALEPSATTFTDRSGRTWIAQSDRLIAVNGNQSTHYSKESSGLDVGEIATISGHGPHLWIGGSNGVAFFDGSRFNSLRNDSSVPFRFIGGIVETAQGDLWLHGLNEAYRIAATDLQRGTPRFEEPLHVTLLDAGDGLFGSAAQRNPRPTLIQGSDGRLWFATNLGVAWLDPATVGTQEIRPNVHIQSATADGRALSLGDGFRVPALTRNLSISYTAAGAVLPTRIRFRYLLEGNDPAWQDAGTRRAAFYSDLKPGAYRFRVLSTDDEGNWLDAGSAVDVRVDPAWFQAAWFKVCCGLALALVAWLLVRLWMRRTENRLRLLVEGQLSERGRIARELHDTFLQTIYEMTLRFSILIKRLPETEPVRAALALELDRASDALAEGRDKVAALRTDPHADLSVCGPLASIGRELAQQYDAEFVVHEQEGERRFSRAIQEEIVSLMREALTNAFRHSNARVVTLEVQSGKRSLKVRVRDNGIGVPSQTLASGRPDHWGLLGMRERAAAIGGRLKISSGGATGGTVVEMTARFRRSKKASLIARPRSSAPSRSSPAS